MDDVIYKQDAIDVVHKAIFDFFDICDDDEESPMTYKDEKLLELNKAITTRIKAVPSAQPDVPVGDMISRQKAYEVLSVYYHHKTDIQHNALREALDKVPSAKIVRCKDCYHYDEEHGRCLLNESHFEPNDFCSYWSE